MPWIIGIDEAGYGPNLGPLVMSSVACRVPPSLVAANLWDVLQAAVRRHPSADDGRLLIEDSKLVYSTQRGLAGLEMGVLATVPRERTVQSQTVAALLDWLSPTHAPELGQECWYSGETPLPAAIDATTFATAAGRFAEALRTSDVAWGLVRSVVICPTRFNGLLDQWGSKGAVLGQGLAELLQCNRDPDGDGEAVHVYVDKHGGRNTYTALLQHALPDCMVVAETEGMDQSVYRVLGAGREIQLTIRPRADAEHFCVALASMVSKYLREVLMREFNQFWQRHLPGIKPTAGYPGDAARFYDEIRPAAQRLGIPEAALWRRK
jgi:ribonuclease HII